MPFAPRLTVASFLQRFERLEPLERFERVGVKSLCSTRI
jgi:hypothetical protein